MLPILTAAAMLAHATTPDYRPARVGVLACQNASMTPLARFTELRPAWFPDGGEAVRKNAGCIPLLNQEPIYVDFFEEVAWQGVADGQKIGGVAKLARGRMRLSDGTDLYFYVPAGDIVPISPTKP